MDFWNVVSQNVSRPFSVERACSSLESALETLSDAEVIEFCREFDDKVHSLYTWDLWGVAYLVNGGCGDDTFSDFRSSLVLLGPTIYEDALRNPESLLQIDADELNELFEEGALYIGSNACQAKGIEAPARKSTSSDPTGEAWDETREVLMVRFPKVWAVYGWEESNSSTNESSSESRPWWKFW